MSLASLKEEVCAANRALEPSGLVKLTWGNVSGIDRSLGLWCIKPSGVAYSDLKPEDLVVLDLDGKVVEGKLRPSSDTKTHLHLYREFAEIGGVTHTHSPYATTFSQAGRRCPAMARPMPIISSGPSPSPVLSLQRKSQPTMSIILAWRSSSVFANLA